MTDHLIEYIKDLSKRERYEVLRALNENVAGFENYYMSVPSLSSEVDDAYDYEEEESDE